MEELAPNVYLLRGFPLYAINVYLIGDVLIDAGIRLAQRGILRQLRGRRLSAHALTHAHPDHQGASAAVCGAHRAPLWCGADDVAAIECGDPARLLPDRWPNWQVSRLIGGPACPVARVLVEGDIVAGFTVLATPGHTPGHLAYWRESDRTLILGDVISNRNPLTGQFGLREPNRRFTPDPARNRLSARKLAGLRPRLVCFGHGPPIRDGARFVEFVAQL